MEEQNEDILRKRIDRLEKEIEEIRRNLKQLNRLLVQQGVEAPPSRDIPVSAPVRTTSAAPPVLQKPFERAPAAQKMEDTSRAIRKGEYWFNRIGIGLLLLGLAFLFKYSIDQGWLTPPVRVGFGLVLGIVLIAIGIFIHTKRKNFSQVLLGGGIAAFYITGFAAFQLYSLVSYPIAFSFMILVTLFAFFLSLRQVSVVLSLIGALGGLGTPFLLYTSSANVPGLVAYTCLVLCGTSAIYFYRGWRSILWISAIGGWIVFFVALTRGFHPAAFGATRDRWALQIGVIFGWLAFWALPLIREILSLKNPERWVRPSLDFLPKSVKDAVADFANQHLHSLTVMVPIITLIVSRLIWKLSGRYWGLIVLGAVVIYSVVSWRLRRSDVGKVLAYTHMIVALLLLTVAFCLLMKGDALFFTLAVEAAALHIISRRLSDRGLEIGAHALFVALAVWLGYRLLIMHVVGAPVLNTHALTSLFVIAAGAGISFLLKPVEARQIYQVIAHLALLGWFVKELSALTNGQAYVTIAWGLYAIALLIVGLRMDLAGIRIAGIVTLFAVVGKLFLIDLSELKAIWRILLFLGFGAIFLFIGYYFQALWRQPSKP